MTNNPSNSNETPKTPVQSQPAVAPQQNQSGGQKQSDQKKPSEQQK
jgi:hypothetical protein